MFLKTRVTHSGTILSDCMAAVLLSLKEKVLKGVTETVLKLVAHDPPV